MDSTSQGFVYLIALIALYFLPTIVAKMRHVENANPTFIINLFLGWTLLGWVVALAMGAGAKKKERAPELSRPRGAAPFKRSRGRVGRAAATIYATPDIGNRPLAVLAAGTLVEPGQRRGVLMYVSDGSVGGWTQADLIELGHFEAPPTTKTCPQCAEQVQFEAKLCRFCRHEFQPATASESAAH